MEEDRVQPSDVYLWWGGEPNVDSCYAFLTLFFEVDPSDIGTYKFDEKVSRNLKTIINIAEKESDNTELLTKSFGDCLLGIKDMIGPLATIKLKVNNIREPIEFIQ